MKSFPDRLRIATRQSPLALWQAERVAGKLGSVFPGMDFEMVSMDTAADKDLSIAISQLGGKGAFCKEIQQIVLAGHADIAVHSAKDLPSVDIDGLSIAGFCDRDEPRDALVGSRVEDLRPGATVATGSNRRRALLADMRPDLQFAELRGNIDTRLAKANDFDAIVMAATALQRLDKNVDFEVLDASRFVPQVGQGALALEYRTIDEGIGDALAEIVDQETTKTVQIERAFLAELGGDCDLPAGAYAQKTGQRTTLGRSEMTVTGVLAAAPITGITRPPLFRETIVGVGEKIGVELAQRLRANVEAA